VSLNLAVLLCIQCSGIHRGLGVQYSKVRSLRLDKCDPSLLLVLEEIGNDVANEIYEAKLGEGEKPNAKSSREELEAFIRAKYVEKRFLLPSEIPEEKKNGELVKAVRNGDLKQTYKLLAQGADIGVKMPGGASLLHIAVEDNGLAVLELLIQRGANVNERDDRGQTPLHAAAFLGRSQCAGLVVKRGADIEAENKEGQTPVDVAAIGQQADTVTLLRLAQLAKNEGVDELGDSFRSALDHFSIATLEKKEGEEEKESKEKEGESEENEKKAKPLAGVEDVQ